MDDGPLIDGYHAHFYFTAETRQSAAAARDRMASELAGIVRVSTLRETPVGPHARPMFEVLIPNGGLEQTICWLMLNHGEHSVLIHPLTGDDVRDHRDHPVWLGPVLPIDFSRL